MHRGRVYNLAFRPSPPSKNNSLRQHTSHHNHEHRTRLPDPRQLGRAAPPERVHSPGPRGVRQRVRRPRRAARGHHGQRHEDVARRVQDTPQERGAERELRRRRLQGHRRGRQERQGPRPDGRRRRVFRGDDPLSAGSVEQHCDRVDEPRCRERGRRA